MTKQRISLLCVLLCLSCMLQAGDKPPASRIRLGILPVFNGSGEAHGEILSQNLTYMIFTELLDSNLEPVLLNPGGIYNPLNTEWISEYSNLAGVEAVVITTLQPMDKPKKGLWSLKLESQVQELQGGKTSAALVSTYQIDRRETGVEVGYVGFWGTTGSRPFQKQPLGRAARSLAQAVRTQVLAEVPRMVTQASGQPHATGSTACDISFHVVYSSKKATSKSYGLIVNGKEESLWLKEGVATLTLSSGPVVIRVNVTDAPYKLSVQRIYLANTWVDCGQPQRSLALEIGPAGEALLQWQ